jgi:hypothetical protein
MIKQVNINMRNFRYTLSIGLGAATLAVVLTYVLGAQALLQTPQAEEGHNLFMSMFKPLIQAITGGHRSMAQIHGASPASEEESMMQGMSESQMQVMNQGLIGNNILGSPATLPAGGLAVIVVTSAIALAAAAFVVSWKQRSFLVAGLLTASGHNTYDTPSNEHELCDSGSHNWSHSWAHDSWAWRGKGYQNSKGCNGSPQVNFFAA